MILRVGITISIIILDYYNILSYTHTFKKIPISQTNIHMGNNFNTYVLFLLGT